MEPNVIDIIAKNMLHLFQANNWMSHQPQPPAPSNDNEHGPAASANNDDGKYTSSHPGTSPR